MKNKILIFLLFITNTLFSQKTDLGSLDNYLNHVGSNPKVVERVVFF